MSLMCGSQDLTLQAILSNGVATVRQTLRRMFSAMAAERAKKRRKLVLTPVYASYRAPAFRVMQKERPPRHRAARLCDELANLISCCLGLVQSWQAQRSLYYRLYLRQSE